MADDDSGFAIVELVGGVVQYGDHPLGDLLVGLGTGDVDSLSGSETGDQIRMGRLELVEGQTLTDPDVELTQPRVEDDLVPGQLGDFFGRLTGSR